MSKIYFGLTDTEIKKGVVEYNKTSKYDTKGVNTTLDGLRRFIKDVGLSDEVRHYTIVDSSVFNIRDDIDVDEEYDMISVSLPFRFSITNSHKLYNAMTESLSEDDEGTLNESPNMILPANDFTYRLDAWKEGKIKHLLIAGLSGSGKSTQGRNLAKEHDAVFIELDLIDQELYDTYGSDKMDKLNETEYAKLFFKTAFAKSGSKKAILEGVWVLDWYQHIPDIKNKAVIIKGTSYLVSNHRAGNRDNVTLPNRIKRFMNNRKTAKHFISLAKSLERKLGEDVIIKESTYIDYTDDTDMISEASRDISISGRTDFVYYNIDKFPNEKNIMYIIGTMGAGKSTIARKIAHDNKAVLIEHDIVTFCIANNVTHDSTLWHSMDEYIDDITKEFIKKHGKLIGKPFNRKAKPDDQMKDLSARLEVYHNWVLKTYGGTKTRIVMEGLWISLTTDTKSMSEYPIIIMRTPGLTGVIRRHHRHMNCKELANEHVITRLLGAIIIVLPLLMMEKLQHLPEVNRFEDRLKQSNPDIENITTMTSLYESYSLNDINIPSLEADDYAIGLQDFLLGEEDVLLVTGICGSGKTTLAKDIAEMKENISGDECHVISLDDFTHAVGITQASSYSEKIALRYYSNRPHLHNSMATRWKDNWNDYEIEVIKYIDYVITISNSENHSVVIEGFQISNENILYTTEYPLVIKMVSVEKATERLKEREGGIPEWYDEKYSVEYVERYKNFIESHKESLQEGFTTPIPMTKWDTVRIKGKKFVPTYVLLSANPTIVGRGIRLATGEPYTHASITSDPSLSRMFSFGMKTDGSMGLAVESYLEGVLLKYKDTGNPARYGLYVTFIEESKFIKLKNRLNKYLEEYDKYGFNFPGLFKVLLKIPNNKQYKMICTEFVTTLLQEADPTLFTGIPSLTTPYGVVKDNDKFVMISEGLMRDYDSNHTVQFVKKVVRSKEISQYITESVNMFDE